MKNILPALLAYLIVCTITILIPASEGYNTFGWKLFVGQIYAIPTFILVAFISTYVSRNETHS